MRLQRIVTALRHAGRAPEIVRCARQFRDWAALTLAYVGVRRMPLPFTAWTRSGASFELAEFYDLETLWQIYCRQVYDVRPTDRLIVDAGANIGLFACFAAARAPRAQVHAVEPFPTTFARLTATIRRNRLLNRVVCHDVALSSSPGVCEMSGNAEASQLFRVARSPAEATAGTPVTATTLSALLESVAGEVDLMKMDIEGSEYDVLLSTPAGALRRVRRLNLEYHAAPAAGLGPRALMAHLGKAGFRVAGRPRLDSDYGILQFAR